MRNACDLLRVATLAATSLVLVAFGVAFVFLVLEVLSPSELWGRYGAFSAGLYATLAFGAVPGVVLGAPVYWWLWRTDHARWTTVFPLGAALGSLVAIVEVSLTPWGVGCGSAVAGLTHFAANRWLEAHSSSKPVLLAGEA